MAKVSAFSFLFVLHIIHKRIEMDLKELGERLRMIRKHLRINQQQLAKATNLTQPAISRLENGEEVYASALLAILNFYRERVNFNLLLDPNLETDDKFLLFCSRQEARQRIDSQLTTIAHHLDESLKQIATLKDEI